MCRRCNSREAKGDENASSERPQSWGAELVPQTDDDTSDSHHNHYGQVDHLLHIANASLNRGKQLHLWRVVTVETVVKPGHERANDEEGNAAVVELCKHLTNELVLVTIHSVEDERHTHAHNGASKEGHEHHLLLNIDLCAWPEDGDTAI